MTVTSPPMTDPAAALAAALTALRRGAPVVLEGREPLLVAPARGITPATITLMACEARGLVCHAMDAGQMLSLGLTLLTAKATRPSAWRFGTSYEAATGCSTGISAADRALTFNQGASETLRPEAIVTPGHVIPVLADPRAAESAPDRALALLALANLSGGAAICTLLDDDGALASSEAARAFAAAHGLALVSALPQPQPLGAPA